ncbi:hypothetical protein FOL47_008922 [Perkinsus chesapeaki]|uniref:RING-type E3 ubiquitin transferase n=1 Tax=Perkinsus chesapeaki TaxID=330153 RepID=A0A7J6LB42_PERCH|nr:hypothetical protein FOL47_008922 [Perkinsus chesapeaki]
MSTAVSRKRSSTIADSSSAAAAHSAHNLPGVHARGAGSAAMGPSPVAELHNAATVDDLFRNYPLSTARSVLSSTRLQVAEKREELRQVTAEHYRDLITCTDNVKKMHYGISQLLEDTTRVANERRQLTTTCETARYDLPMNTFSTGLTVAVSPELELGRELKRLLDMSEAVWRMMHDRGFTAAAKYYLVDLPNLQARIASLKDKCPDTKLPVAALLKQQAKAGQDVPSTIKLSCKQALASLNLTLSEMQECCAVLLLMEVPDAAGKISDDAIDQLRSDFLAARESLIFGSAQSVEDRMCAFESTLRMVSSGSCDYRAIVECAKRNGLPIATDNIEARGKFIIDGDRKAKWKDAVLDAAAKDARKCSDLRNLTVLRNRLHDRLEEYLRSLGDELAGVSDVSLWPEVDSAFQAAGLRLLKEGLPKSGKITDLTEHTVESLESSACDSQLWQDPRTVVIDVVATWLSERCDALLSADLSDFNIEDIGDVALYSSALLGYTDSPSLCAQDDFCRILSSVSTGSVVSKNSSITSFVCRSGDAVGSQMAAAVSGCQPLTGKMEKICERSTRAWCSGDLLAHVHEETPYQTAWRVSSALLSAGSESTARVLSIVKTNAIEKYPDNKDLLRYLDGGLDDSKSALLFVPLSNRGESRESSPGEPAPVVIDSEPAFSQQSVPRFATLPVASGRTRLSSIVATPKAVTGTTAVKGAEEKSGGASSMPYDFASFFSQKNLGITDFISVSFFSQHCSIEFGADGQERRVSWSLRKRRRAEAEEEDEAEKGKSELILPEKTHRSGIATGSTATNKTDDDGKWQGFQMRAGSRLSSQSDATRTLETESDRVGDARSQYERNAEIQGKIIDGELAEGLYRGLNAGRKYMPTDEHKKANSKLTGALGPNRASANARVSCVFDYQPHVCKDYKETGYCGFGDSCIYLHDRSDYKSGWQLEQEWEEKKKKNEAKMQKRLEKQMKKRAQRAANGNSEVEEVSDASSSSDSDSSGSDSDSDSDSDDDDKIPFACYICRKKWADCVEPSVTTCGHYFCEPCFFAKCTERCPVCQQYTGGICNSAGDLIKKKAESEKHAKEEAHRQKHFSSQVYGIGLA